MNSIVKFLLDPLILIFGLFLWYLITAKKINPIVNYIILFFYLVSIPITGELFHNVWKIKDTYKSDKLYDGVIVLAGALETSWYLDDISQNKFIYNAKDYFHFNYASERLYAGIHFVKSGLAKKVFHSNYIAKIFYNNKSFSLNNSVLVKKFAIQNGIDDSNFIIFGEPVKNTYDEGVEFKKYLKGSNENDILLITSEVHMRRASRLFENQGLFLDRYSVNRRLPFTKILKKIHNYIPQISGLKLTKNILYETIGYLGYYLKGAI